MAYQYGKFVGRRTSSIGQALRAFDPGPEAAIGKAIVDLVVLETAGEFLLGKVGDEAEVGSGDADWAVQVEGGEIAIVPGTAEEG